MNRENLNVYKAHIIGGGFAGMVLAITLAEKFGGQNILLTERNDRLGKNPPLLPTKDLTISACISFLRILKTNLYGAPARDAISAAPSFPPASSRTQQILMA